MAAIGGGPAIKKQFANDVLLDLLSTFASTGGESPQIEQAAADVRREVVSLNTSRSSMLTGDLESANWNGALINQGG